MDRLTLLLCELIQDEVLDPNRVLQDPDTAKILFDTLVKRLVSTQPVLRHLPIERILASIDWDMVLIAAAIKRMGRERAI